MFSYWSLGFTSCKDTQTFPKTQTRRKAVFRKHGFFVDTYPDSGRCCSDFHPSYINMGCNPGKKLIFTIQSLTWNIKMRCHIHGIQTIVHGDTVVQVLERQRNCNF